jgi:molybdenum cofactor guanylyltransferase
LAENCYDSAVKRLNDKKYNIFDHGVPKMIAAIQAGGRSSRMGADKAWLPLDGRPMIEAVLRAAQPITDRLVIIVNAANPSVAKYEQLAARWDAELLPDLHDYRGPLGGIETALRQCSSNESALILACDLPFVTTEFLQQLQAIHTTQHYDLTIPLDAAARPQMLAGFYAQDCLTHVAAMLAADDLKTQLLQARVKTRCVRFEEYSHLTAAERLLHNINAPEDRGEGLGFRIFPNT